MLSKEEIKSGLQDLIIDRESFIDENDKESIFVKDKEILESAISYIDQLESEMKEVTSQRNELATELSDIEDNKQELIEKLENKFNNIKKQKLPKFKTLTDVIKYKGYAEGKIESYNEILEIVKGEKR